MTNLASGPIHDLLVNLGYSLVDDAWSQYGRRSYIHDSDFTRSQFICLRRMLRQLGWSIDQTTLRSFINSGTGEMIEMEPGGPDTTGHFVHHMTSNNLL